jgi:hypothetical protein
VKFTRQIFNHLMGDAQAQDASDAAQAAFDKWLSEQVVVYSEPEFQSYWIPRMDPEHTHRARLVAIEELPNAK